MSVLIEGVQRDIRGHHHRERRAGSLLIVLGGAGVLLGAVLLSGQEVFLGGGLPMLTGALLQLWWGIDLFLGAERRTARLLAQLEVEPDRLVARERLDAERRRRRFNWLGICDIGLLVASGILEFIPDDLLWGAGLGLGIQAALLLCLHVLAAERAETYARQLLGFEMARKLEAR